MQKFISDCSTDYSVTHIGKAKQNQISVNLCQWFNFGQKRSRETGDKKRKKFQMKLVKNKSFSIRSK